MEDRIKALKESLDKKKIDGYLVAHETNIFYFTGAKGAARLIIPSVGENVLYVHWVNYEEAKKTAKGCRVDLVKREENVDKKTARLIQKLNLKRLGFDVLDSSVYLKLRNAAKGTRLVDMNQQVWELRKVKDEVELGCIRKAAEITNEGARRAAEVISYGIREYEVAAEIEYAMRRLGSEGVAFETIVASGPKSAFPHGGCSDKKIREGELVVVDIGAKYKSYRADLTRTFLVGEPSSEQAKIYRLVRESQQKAFESLRDGIKAREADAIARRIVERPGYGEYFVHGLGHGVGLDVHEPPTLNPNSRDALKAGNVVTVEPGIYIPSSGGVRIEDTVLILRKEAERLTEGAYDLRV